MPKRRWPRPSPKQREAERVDALRAEELAAAEHKLKQAEADVAAARAALASVNDRINEEILVTTQQSHGFVNLLLLFSDVDASNLNQRAQLAETLFDSSARQLDELEMRRFMLEDAEVAADQARSEADGARVAAAKQLEASKAAAAKAEGLRAEVADLVKQRDAAEQSASAQLAAEQKREEDLKVESADVERRIQERIEAERKAEEERLAREKAAKEKAEREAREQAARDKAARDKAAADKAAADKAAADRAAADRAAHSNSADQSAGQTSRAADRPDAAPAKPAAQAAVPANKFLSPVDGRLTSRFGMRLHPVLGYWKLHDGTDYGASCGPRFGRPGAGGR